MKKLLLSSLFLSMAWCLAAQPFFLFPINNSKDFAPLTETWERNYSLKMDSTYIGNVISVFYIHTVMNEIEEAVFTPDENDPDECFGWGGCRTNSGSTGFGGMIFSPLPFHYDFYTLGGDTLRFNLFADSSVFFQNEEELYALIYEGESEQMVFNDMEMVKSYRIGHYTAEGNALATPLHDFVIRVGETTGMIDFFQIDDFPSVEMPLTLIGDANHDQSLTVMTGEMIYDFQVGDTIQYKMTSFEAEPGNPNFVEEISFLNRIFLSRVEEEDSLRYTVLHQSFEQGELNLEEWTEELAYSRFDTLASLPFYRRRNTGDYGDGSYQEYLFKRDFCGDVRIGFGGVSAPFFHCENHDAWCSFDTNGPAPITSYEYVPGLGQYLHEVDRNGFNMFTSWREATEVVYFSKGGNSCGQEAILSIGSQERTSLELTVYPNPTQGLLNVRIASEALLKPSALNVLHMSGRTVASYPWQGANGTFDVSQLASGLYLLQVVGDDGVLGVKRFVVE
jgi:hypothetical protein